MKNHNNSNQLKLNVLKQEKINNQNYFTGEIIEKGIINEKAEKHFL
jgi:hypothetical protein